MPDAKFYAAMCYFADCHYAEWEYAECSTLKCRYAECCDIECHGTISTIDYPRQVQQNLNTSFTIKLECLLHLLIIPLVICTLEQYCVLVPSQITNDRAKQW